VKLNLFDKILGTFFYTGYLPKMPGTYTSFMALLLFMIPGFENPFLLMILISFFTAVGVLLGNKFEKVHGKDPSIFTLDEVVGTWISLLFVKKTIYFVLIAFVIWRILDILKPYPANLVEKIEGGWGIMLDDIISGIYTLIIMTAIINIIN
jgi:phosphatidylglycerophosphatase A